MADDAANQTPATATVIRVTDKQVRLRLDEANGGREVTKRVAVPEEARERLDGTTVPVVLHGTGARARVELADDWLTPAKPKRSRSRGGAKAKVEAVVDAPPAAEAEEAPAKPRRKRTRGAAAAPADDAPTAESIAEAAPAEETTPKPKRGSRRRRSGGASDAPKSEPQAEAAPTPDEPAAQPAPVAAAPAPRDEAEVRERIAAAVELVRAARRPVAR